MDREHKVPEQQRMLETPWWEKTWAQGIILLSAAAGLFGVGWAVYTYFVPVGSKVTDAKSFYSEGSDRVSTSTINVSDVLTKANTLDTLVEKQDFLKKYVGSKIFGVGAVDEVSRSGDGFMLDVIISSSLVSCRLSGNEENEKRLPLLKGKSISFSGIFTLSNIFGHGLSIEDCNLLK